jgi:hypothetical protein
MNEILVWIPEGLKKENEHNFIVKPVIHTPENPTINSNGKWLKAKIVILEELPEEEETTPVTKSNSTVGKEEVIICKWCRRELCLCECDDIGQMGFR